MGMCNPYSSRDETTTEDAVAPDTEASPSQQRSPDQYMTLSYPETIWLGDYHELHFNLAATTVESGDPDALEELGEEDLGRCTGRFSPNSRARVGDRIEINVDTAKLQFFDPRTPLAIRS